MNRKNFCFLFFLYLISLPIFSTESINGDIPENDLSAKSEESKNNKKEIFEKTDELIEGFLSEDFDEENEKEIKINKDILNNNNKELFPKIPNPFYEPDTSVSYDEEPITILGINARWLSDKLPNHDISHLFTFDLGYTLNGWEKNGWGIGLNYEQKIWRYFSLKGTLATTTYHFADDNLWCTGIEEDLTFFCYPFGKGLEWLYLGCGLGADQLFYYDNDTTDLSDSIFSFMPVIGWKQIFAKKFMVDLNVGYRMTIYNTENYEDNTDYIRTGFQFGFKIMIFWKRLLKSYVDSVIRKKNIDQKKRQQLDKAAANPKTE